MSPQAQGAPAGAPAITPYLIVRGAAAAIDFYKEAFGAREESRMVDGQRIGHAEIRIGEEPVMLADEYPELGIVGPRSLGGSPVRIHAYVPDVDAVCARAAAAGAKILQPPTDQPCGDRTAKLEDPFGHVWICATHRGAAAPAKPRVRAIPPGLHTVTPYLVVAGAPGLIDFLRKAFGAREKYRSQRPDGTIQHAELWIGDSVVMMGEAGGPWKPMIANLSLYLEDTDAAYRHAMEAGGKSLREPQTMFYGDRTAGVEDPCGNFWWISTHIEDVSAEEIERRTAEAAGGKID